MTETKTCLADTVSILEVDEGIFIRGKVGEDYIGGLAANLEEKRILDGLMANLMKKKDGAA